MINIIYAPVFVRQYKKLDEDLQNEILEKIELFKDESKHTLLKVHKLHGKFKDKYSFYINYKIRIVFMWQSSNSVAILAVGDHDIYK